MRERDKREDRPLAENLYSGERKSEVESLFSRIQNREDQEEEEEPQLSRFNCIKITARFLLIFLESQSPGIGILVSSRH